MPTLSVVIPVHNKWELTAACLRSLAEHTPGGDVAVIVVDNASADDTSGACPALGSSLFGRRFRYRRFENNRNFGPACNAGAALADSALLFFLNNDTLLTPGWLPPLQDALAAEPDLVGVGPLLAYPDDTVQHLGIVITPAGDSIGHLYAGLPLAHPLARRRRRFPAITGAALMVSRALFLEAGGFCEAYVNGFEDVDFCLALAENGGVMSVIPESRVIHFESQTPQRRDHDEDNGRLLRARRDLSRFVNMPALAEEDDYVLVTVAIGEIQSMKAATVETGKADTYASGYVTVVGTKYNKTALLKDNDTEANEDFYAVDYDSEMAAILDEYGYLIGIVVEEEADSNYDYVLVTDSEGKKGGLLSSSAAVVEVMFLDGTTDVLPLETRKEDGHIQYKLDGKWFDVGEEGGDLHINGWYRYTMNDDDQIVLRALKADKAVGDTNATVEFRKDQEGHFKVNGETEKAGRYFMNSSTVYHIVDEDNVKTYTGYKNIDIDEAGVNALMLLDGKVITDLYILNSEVENDDIYAYYDGTTYETSKGTYVTLFVDGEAVNYLVESDLFSDGKGVYTITVSGDEVTAANQEKALSSRAKVTAASELYFTVNDEREYYAEDAKVFDITDDGVEATISRGDYVVFVKEGAFVTYAYIVSAPDNTTPDKPETGDHEATATGKTTSDITFNVTNVGENDKIKVVAFNYNNGIQAELDSREAALDADSLTYTSSVTGQLTFKVYVVTGDKETLVDTFGPYSFVVD